MTGDSMKISRIALVLACFIGLSQSAWSQKPSEATSHGILGYLDPQTGAFRPLAQTPATPESEDALAAAPAFGSLVFNITITVKSTNLGSDTIGCGANASVFEATGQSIEESAFVAATGTGATRTCKVTIPYSWPLSTPTTDSITLGIDVGAAASSSSLASPIRSHTRSLPPIKVPLGGATTTFTVAVTI
jgi:hypothetical protein